MAPVDQTTGGNIRYGPMNMVINTVLAMLTHGLNSGTRPNVEHVAETTFNSEEVKSAASVLWDHCGLGDPPRRVISKLRSECSAVINDVLDKLTEMRRRCPSKVFRGS